MPPPPKFSQKLDKIAKSGHKLIDKMYELLFMKFFGKVAKKNQMCQILSNLESVKNWIKYQKVVIT